MRILIEVGNTMETLDFPDDTSFEVNTPIHGFIRAVSKGRRDSWLNSIHVVAMLPDEVEE